jgi:hypothetical protein
MFLITKRSALKNPDKKGAAGCRIFEKRDRLRNSYRAERLG